MPGQVSDIDISASRLRTGIHLVVVRIRGIWTLQPSSSLSCPEALMTTAVWRAVVVICHGSSTTEGVVSSTRLGLSWTV
jgi:hypothetical protein